MKRTELLFGNNTKTITEFYPTDDIKYLFNLINESDHKRSTNYNLFTDGYAYTVTYLDQEPAMCSLAWERPLFNGSIRVLTRFGIRPDLIGINFGKGMENWMRLDVIEHFTQQIDICKKLGCETFFASQESRIGNRRIKCVASTLSKYSKIDWKVTDNKIQVTPNKKDMQYLIYNKPISFDYTSE